MNFFLQSLPKGMVFGAWSPVFFACFGLAAEVNSVEVAPASGSSGLGTGSIFGSGGAVVAAVAVADGQFFSWGRALHAGRQCSFAVLNLWSRCRFRG